MVDLNQHGHRTHLHLIFNLIYMKKVCMAMIMLSQIAVNAQTKLFFLERQADDRFVFGCRSKIRQAP